MDCFLFFFRGEFMKKALIALGAIFLVISTAVFAGKDKNNGTSNSNNDTSSTNDIGYGKFGIYPRTLVKCSKCNYEWNPPRYKEDDVYLCPRCWHWTGKEVK